MDSDLRTIVYCSTSAIKGTEAEIADALLDLLDKARLKNSCLGITGALLYNHGDFAQVLEGHPRVLDRLVATIDADPRHRNVTVALDRPIAERAFPVWTMAFGLVGEHPAIDRAIGAVFAGAPNADENMLDVLKKMIVKEDDWLV